MGIPQATVMSATSDISAKAIRHIRFLFLPAVAP
jgi:hypothetical protein